MGTIVAVKKNSGIAIAADCCNVRDPIMRTGLNISHGCILQFGESYIGLSSSLGFQQSFEEVLTELREGTPRELDSRERIRDFFLRVHDLLKHRRMLYVNFQQGQEFEWTPMNALVVNKSGIYKVDTTRAVYEFTRFWALGSGEAVALGAMAAVYDRIDSPEEIASTALAAVKELEVDHRRDPEILTLKAPKIIAVPTPVPSPASEVPADGVKGSARIRKFPQSRKPRNRSR